MNISQIWLKEEADRYYLRNRDHMYPRKDLIIEILEFIRFLPHRVLEIGAANGWRLEAIRKKWGAEVWAVEPSEKAIEEGSRLFPKVNFRHGIVEEVDLEGSFDLVIVSFVFHWIDRNNLYFVTSRIDRWVEEGGLLIIGDFGYPGFFKRPYHHREGLYTWKMDYGTFFFSSGKYLEILKLRYPYEERKVSPRVDPYDCASLWILRKVDCYLEEK